MENAMVGMQEQVMRFCLPIRGYLEKTLEKMRRNDPDPGRGVTADQLLALNVPNAIHRVPICEGVVPCCGTHVFSH